MKTLYFDCYSGASGDMIVGALLDAGADFDAIKSQLATLNLHDYELSAERVKKHGVMGTQFLVKTGEHHPHRHLKHMIEIVRSGSLPEPVIAASEETFRRIGEVEAEIHGSTVERIHFHEVGAVDSIIDVVAAHLALHQLGIEACYASALHVGSGTVKCAHGVMPVPAPATAKLLAGVPSYGGDVEGELVTPTGAALVTQLAKNYGGMPAMRVASIGYGSGTKDLPDRPNLLRVVIGESDDAVAATETISIIETNIDDMNPELMPALLEEVLAAGARDAFVTQALGKKGRPAQVVTALCDDGNVADVARALFKGSTTLGLRIRNERRITLQREFKHVDTTWGRIPVKIGLLDGRTHTAAPEFDACKEVAAKANVSVRQVYDAALAAALNGEWRDG